MPSAGEAAELGCPVDVIDASRRRRARSARHYGRHGAEMTRRESSDPRKRGSATDKIGETAKSELLVLSIRTTATYGKECPARSIRHRVSVGRQLDFHAACRLLGCTFPTRRFAWFAG